MFLDTTIDMNDFYQQYSNNTYESNVSQLGFINLETVSSNFTLEENYVTIGDITGNFQLTLPDVSLTKEPVTCIFDFTTSTNTYPTITNKNIKIKDMMYFLFTTTANTRNRLIFTSSNGSNCWEVELERYGE